MHSTEQTGDVQTFAVCQANYDSGLIKRMREMLSKPLMGYRIGNVSRDEDRICFSVLREVSFLPPREVELTRNSVFRQGQSIMLHTSIVYPMPPNEAQMMADLEQCAALMLVEVEIPNET